MKLNGKQAVAFITSPLQLLNAREWEYQSDGSVHVLLLEDYSSGRTRLQLEAVLSEFDFDISHLGGFPRSGWSWSYFGIPYLIKVGRIVREINMLLSGGDFDVLLVGDPRVALCQHAMRFWESMGGREIVVLDDGSAASIIAKERHEYVLQSSVHGLSLPRFFRRHVSGMRCGWPAALAFFSIYDLGLPEVDRLVKNKVSYLRSLPVFSNEESWFVGSNNVEAGITTERAYLSVLRSIHESEGVALYLAHRREGPDKLEKVQRIGFTVVCPDLPLEYYCAIKAGLPRRLYGIASTVFDTFSRLWEDQLELILIDPGPNYVLLGAREQLNLIVEENLRTADRVLQVLCEY